MKVEPTKLQHAIISACIQHRGRLDAASAARDGDLVRALWEPGVALQALCEENGIEFSTGEVTA